MKIFKRFGFYGAILGVCLLLAVLLSLFSLELHGALSFPAVLTWSLFFLVVLLLFSNVTLSHKFAAGKAQEMLFFASTAILISMTVSYLIYCLIQCHLDFSKLDWYGFLGQIVGFDLGYWGLVLLVFVGFVLLYGGFIDRRIINFVGAPGLRGKGKLKQVDANLENSHWMNKEEKDKIFKSYKYTQLGELKKDGIPVMATVTKNGKDMDVSFNSPCHSIIIGSTGSGKTTTFVSPMIQLLGATAAGSSMVITDPKGELFSLHSKYLASRGYDVKVVDLRDTYSSYRWNPLDGIWDNYEKYRNAHQLATLHSGEYTAGDRFRLVGDPEKFKGLEKWYEFDGKAYYDYDMLVEAIKVYKKKTFDEVYEDLNDLTTVLIPVENEKDPMWEKGARAITLATLLAMLEDSENPELGMTKGKFNFFNLTKILQNSANDYEDLRNYFKGRSPLSKALSLSKQVCDAATQTRASYMSIVYEKLTLFNDAGICALTSSSDFTGEQLADRPTALFLKIPDEKDTRHNLAAIFILNIYKTLIKVASATEELTLPRNVYFIMDEFGNMPKIEKFDKFITVGRSRKIWFNMIVQSYAQLNNVYGETVAEIVKGNCGIKMFIGSNDMGTCKEYSELCGNITVVTTSSSGSVKGGGTDVNISAQTQVRPLIYPSELQRLNKPGDIGHSIIVTFGNYPLKTRFTPSFNVPFYQTGKMDTSETERFFDERKVFYSIRKRNLAVLNPTAAEAAGAAGGVTAAKKAAAAETAAAETAAAEASANEAANAEAESNAPETMEDALLEAFREYRREHESATLEEFFAAMAALSAENQTR